MDDLEDFVLVIFMFVIDGFRRFWHMIIATVVVILIVWWIASIQSDAEQACRDKGGTPITSDSHVTCATGVIK